MKVPRLLSIYPESQSIMKSWQDIHAIIFNKLSIVTSLSESIDLSIYYYTVYKTFEHEQDLAHAQRFFVQGLTYIVSSSRPIWDVDSILDLTGIAQLTHWFAKNKQPFIKAEELLAAADSQLLTQAQQLLVDHQATQKRFFFRILRYFQLRLPASGIAATLNRLFEQAQLADDNHKWTLLLPIRSEPKEGLTILGLGDGLAGEALQLIRLYKAGIQQPILLKAIKARILAILATRREVDFSEGIYSMFPDAITSDTDQIRDSQELTWRGGDLGQALLLYEACMLLQDEELAWLAELVGLNTLLRKEEGMTSVHTSAFYTGAAGIAHLYYQLHRISGNPAYEAGHRYWVGKIQRFLPQDIASGLYERQSGLRYDLTSMASTLLAAVTAQPIEREQRLW
ncbi:glycoside hydrolase family protein [Hymenobacter crusticola]|uniref:Uncharacterized protein n=1 Tax=Hymenobacter crusticola TaxID=1770526 RepID=A0A243W994_9BACT|nr:hypothetical protein [Hymenobacter crusticola]OUJ71067.1 hypothetical protein BXP70_23175 [Hymenobacter crusticola]